ncbi:MAG TPA: acyl-CoA desaturase [Candidatus Paceibacterota bacterium]|nr:acyl-CoA desaturase [Candidatus Paceibacterota bacterium]
MASPTNYYPELQEEIEKAGLMDKQPAYYYFKIFSTLALWGISITILVVVDTFWLQLLNAAFLAFVFGQIGYIGHDAGHRGAFRSIRGNELAGLGASFFICLSRSWWVTQHNQHHATPNDLEQDPHTTLPFLAFSKESALGKSKFMRRLVGYQAFYFIPLLPLEGLGIRLASIQFLLKQRKVKYPVLEPLLMGLHFLLYFGLLFWFLTPWQVLGFFLVHQALFGLYYGTVFAPNHKGMLVLEKDNKLDFLHTQVLTTRNVKPGLITDFWYGGLNYQIEHHLFPLMPRNRLGAARKIIKTFCEQHDISYCETGTFRSYREILSYLHEVTAPVRGWPWRGKGTLAQST